MEIIAHGYLGNKFANGARCDAIRFFWNNPAIRRTVRQRFLQLAFRRDNISRSRYPAATPVVRAVMSGERMLPSHLGCGCFSCAALSAERRATMLWRTCFCCSGVNTLKTSPFSKRWNPSIIACF